MSRKLGDFVLLEMLHRDWLGVCHAAFDSVRGRRVSLRLVAGDIGRNAASVAALRSALRCSDNRIHANVAAVYDVGAPLFEPEHSEGGMCYVASELLQGERLSALLAEDRVDPPRAHVLLSQVLLGLGCAHKLGMIHADLNPSNVLVQSGDELLLLEVGLCSRAILTGVDESMSAGWPMFMAPEQLLGEQATVRSDLRAAGVLLYRMLAGRDPFSGSSALVLQKVLSEELPPLSQVKPDLGTRFDGVVAKATARRAEQRFQSAQEFLHALNRVEFDASSAGAGAGAGARAEAAAGPVTMDAGARDRLATALRSAVGPIASILLENALRQSNTAEQCRAALAAQITDAHAREVFLRATLEIRVDAAAPSGTVPVNAAMSQGACMSQGAWPLHVADLQRLIARLSEDIGPMATLLVERSAARAASREEFIARLTAALPANVTFESWRAHLGP